MNLENEKVPSPVNAPESYFKEFESRLLQRLGIDKNSWVENQPLDTSVETENTAELVAGISTKKVVIETPKMELNPVTNVDPPLTSKKQEPTTITSSPVRKEIEEVGQIHIDPLKVSTNETPEWVNFAAIDGKEGESELGDVANITMVNHGDLANEPEQETPIVVERETESEELVLQPVHGESNGVPSWTEIAEEKVVETPVITAINSELDEVAATEVIGNTEAPSVTVHHVPEFVDDEEALKAEYEAMQKAKMVAETPAEPLKMESVQTPVESGSVFSSNVGRIESRNDRPVESKLYNQHAPGTDTLEPPPTPFAPIAGLQEKPSSPNWIGAAASIAAIVAAYFIWTAIQPSTEDAVTNNDSMANETTVAVQNTVKKDTVAPGVRLVEHYILDKKLEKYEEPKIFSIDQKEDLSAKSIRALNDLEHHNIAVFDMEDNLFEELDLDI